METAELVKTGETTNDGELTLYYEMRPDPPHNPLRYGFRWVDVEGTVAGPFQTYESAQRWREGYEYGAGCPS
jgi:hypothetical protein